MSPRSKPLPVIVTDLDGTLLDHHSYSFAAAIPALAMIAECGYPLILNSSKTRAEMLYLQQMLGLHQPFICENGAAVFLPEGNDWRCQSFAPPRDEWLPWLHLLREAAALPFRGFSDWDTDELAAKTDLPEDAAKRAASREYTEPLLWRGCEDARLAFAQTLAQKGLRLVRGGRFYSVQGDFDKATAMQWLAQYYRKQGPVITIALGDSPNDCAMLNAADIAVVIKSAQSESMEIHGPQQIIRTDLPGPEGWQQAMTKILKDLDN